MKLSISAVIWASLIAGAVFLAMEMMLIMLAGDGNVWGPPRMMAAIVMGTDVLPPPATMDLPIVMVGMMVHFALSVVLGIILGLGISSMGIGMVPAVLLGGVFGLITYGVNFYGFTALFPWFEMARTWITVASHIIFGAVLGGVYRAMAAAPKATIAT